MEIVKKEPIKEGKEMTITGFDKEVERQIRFLQSEYNCIVIISERDAIYYMDVCFIATGEIKHGIELCGADTNKYKLMLAMRNYFKQI